MKILLIIPSLEPNENLLELLYNINLEFSKQEQAHISYNILIVDDGSSSDYADIFEQAVSQYNCILLQHATNLGKGRALKTAFNYYLNNFSDYTAAVTVDSDGQHCACDIIRCINELSGLKYPALILGCRDFNSDGVPARNRLGNILTRIIFNFLCGVKISDTQTGLRAIPTELVKTMLTIPGERFEYEMNMLLECSNKKIKMVEVFINTIYIKENKGTHFHPLFDSVRVYITFVKYIISSLGASCIDYVIFFTATALDNTVAMSMVLSRTGSSIFNFTVNRNIVFKSNKNIWVSAVKYILLVALSGTASYYILTLLNIYLPLFASKVIAESLIFFANFFIQRTKIFD